MNRKERNANNFKLLHPPKREWRETNRPVAKVHECPTCGNRRALYICNLRTGLKYCELCKTTYVVSERLEKGFKEAYED